MLPRLQPFAAIAGALLLASSIASGEEDAPAQIAKSHLDTLEELAVRNQISQVVIFFESFPPSTDCRVSIVQTPAAARANRANLTGDLSACAGQTPEQFERSLRPKYVQLFSRVLSVPNGDSNALIEVWDHRMASPGTGRYAGQNVAVADWTRLKGWTFRTIEIGGP